MDVVGKLGRGQTYYGTETIPTTYEGPSVAAEGIEKMFDDVAAGQTTQVLAPRSNNKLHARLLRNASAVTLQAGNVVTFKAGYRKRRVGGLTTTDAEEVAGVVDDFLPSSGCRVGDLCWVFFKGPVNTDKETGDDLAEAEVVTCNNAGKVQTIGVPGSATAAQNTAINVVGRVYTAALAGDTKVIVDLNLP